MVQPKKARRRRFWIVFRWLMLVGYLAAIFFFSSKSRNPIGGSDKLIHGVAYAVLTALAWTAFRTVTARGVLVVLLAFLLASSYGAMDEWHQSFVPGRISDVRDWLADTIGAGVILILLLVREGILRASNASRA